LSGYFEDTIDAQIHYRKHHCVDKGITCNLRSNLRRRSAKPGINFIFESPPTPVERVKIHFYSQNETLDDMQPPEEEFDSVPPEK